MKLLTLYLKVRVKHQQDVLCSPSSASNLSPKMEVKKHKAQDILKTWLAEREKENAGRLKVPISSLHDSLEDALTSS